MTAPCKDCDRRHTGCHSECDDYKMFRAEQDKVIEAKAKARSAEPAIPKKVVKQIYKEMKGK